MQGKAKATQHTLTNYVYSLPSIGRFMVQIGQKSSFLEVHSPVGKFQTFRKMLLASCSELMFSSFPHTLFCIYHF